MPFPPQRIVCLTEETVETLYLLGQQDRIVGVSGYAVRPPQVRREKPRVSAFTSANLTKILALAPDLVLTFSDLQADIVAELVRSGVEVHAFNHRTVAGIFDMIRIVAALVGAAAEGKQLTMQLNRKSAKDRIVNAAAVIAAKPDIVIGSWCGKKFRADRFAARTGYDVIPAVRDGQLFEIKSSLILQPGPAALTDGLDAIARIIAQWAGRDGCAL